MAIIDTENIPLTGPTAHRLADMAGIHLDLRWTAGACAQLVRRQNRPRPDSMAIEGMHDAAFIRYARCFKKGRRSAFQIPDDWIGALPAQLQKAHRLAIALRDKHIAHSINDWEINVPVANVARVRDSGVATVRSVSVQQMRVVMLGRDLLMELHELAKTLADRVYASMSELQKELLEEIRGVSPRQLKRLAPKVFPSPGRRGPANDRGRS